MSWESDILQHEPWLHPYVCWSGNMQCRHDPVLSVNGNFWGFSFIQVKCKGHCGKSSVVFQTGTDCLFPRGSCLQNLVDLSQLAQGSNSIKVFLQKVSESHRQQEILWLFDLFTSTFSYPSLMTAIYWQWGLWSEHRRINCHTNWHPQFYSSDDGSWHQLIYVNERRQHRVEMYREGLLESLNTNTWSS